MLNTANGDGVILATRRDRLEEGMVVSCSGATLKRNYVSQRNIQNFLEKFRSLSTSSKNSGLKIFIFFFPSRLILGGAPISSRC